MLKVRGAGKARLRGKGIKAQGVIKNPWQHETLPFFESRAFIISR